MGNNNSSNITLKELRSLFGAIVTSDKSRKGCLIFDRELKMRYKEWYVMTSEQENGENFKKVFLQLPDKLPSLPKHFETFIAIVAVVCPLVLSAVFYWMQADLFFSTLISISATPLFFLVFYTLTKVILERQYFLVMNLSQLMELLKR